MVATLDDIEEQGLNPGRYVRVAGQQMTSYSQRG